MTREDIDRISSEYFDDKESEHEMDEVFDLAKKALEERKEDMLDKIRAEIEELDGKYVIGDYASYGEHSPKYVQLLEVLHIIAKYKAETEHIGK